MTSNREKAEQFWLARGECVQPVCKMLPTRRSPWCPDCMASIDALTALLDEVEREAYRKGFNDGADDERSGWQSSQYLETTHDE